MNFKNILSAWNRFWKSPKGKTTSKIIRTCFILAMLTYLAWQIYDIGLWNIVRSLPTTPYFYLLFLVLYFALPISEQFIYRLSLKFSFLEGLKVFIEKKILNTEISYSGEAYFFLWAKNNLKEKPKVIFNAIKDNNIISSFASTIMAVVSLAIFAYMGNTSFADLFNISISKNVLIVVGILAIIAISVGIYYRKYVISMNANMAMKVFGIHALRILFVYPIEILMWSVAVPDIPFHIWSAFLAAKIVASRIPFFNQDLLFVSLGIGMYQGMDIGERPEVSAVILISTVLAKFTGIILYSLFLSNRNKISQEEINSYAQEKAKIEDEKVI